MTTYLQCLDNYKRYQRIQPTLKLAELANGKYWYRGNTGAQYFTEDNEGWTNDEAFNALFSQLSPEQQQSYRQSGNGQNINALIASALANPQAYGDMLTYIVKDQELALKGKRSALSTVLDQNPFAKQVVDQMRTKIQEKEKGAMGVGRRLLGGLTDGIVRKNAIGGVQEFMTGGPQQGQQQAAPATPQQQTQQQQQQNPSMWNYMLPALAAGAPLALLGGLGGGKGMGLGLLGLAGLGGLGYGYARSQGWDGWSPVENMANMMNGWFGMGGQQNAQGQQAGTQPAATQTPAPPAYREGLRSLGKDDNGYERFWAGPGAINGYNDGGKGVNVYYDPKKKSYMAEDFGFDSKLDNFTPFDTSTPAAPSAPSTNTAMSATGTPGTGGAAWNANTNQASPGAGTAATTFGPPKKNT